MEPNNKQAQEQQQLKEEERLPWAWINAVHDELSTGPFNDPQLPVQVLPWLFISDLPSLSNTSELVQDGITHVLTTNKLYSAAEQDKLKKRLTDAGIKHFSVSGQDYPGYDMIANHWDDCRAFLEKVRNEHANNKVIVHCAAGLNRSGLIVAAALACIEQMSLLNAVKLLKETRGGMVMTNRCFQKQLCVLAMKEGRLGEKPKGYIKDTERIFMVENNGYDQWL